MFGLSVGASSAIQPTSYIISELITVSHTNGAQTLVHNSGQGESNFTTSGLTASGINAVLTGTWMTLPIAASMVSLNIKSNIVADDIPAGGLKHAVVMLNQGHVVSSGSATSGVRINRNVNQGTALSAGPSYSAPGNVGDIGTFEMLGQMPSFNAGHRGLVIGTNYLAMNNIVSPGYFNYTFQIHADYPTKDYKFILELEVSMDSTGLN